MSPVVDPLLSDKCGIQSMIYIKLTIMENLICAKCFSCIIKFSKLSAEIHFSVSILQTKVTETQEI